MQQSPFETQQETPKVTRTEFDMREVAKPTALSAAEAEGKRLWVQRCAICHDPLGQPAYPRSLGPWIDQKTVEARGDERVRTYINTGSNRMPAWRYTLEANQIDMIIAYLKTVPPSQKPTGTSSSPKDIE